MSNRKCPTREQLSGYASGALPLTTADEVTLHIADCAECEDTLQGLNAAADGLLKRIQAGPAVEAYVDEAACLKVVSHLEGQAPSADPILRDAKMSRPSTNGPQPERVRTMNRTEFVDFVTTAGLLSSDEITVTLKTVPQAQATDVQSLAKLLVQQEKLTKYQAAAIYQGKGKSLFYGDYLVLDRIGAGGMGQVFKARHRRMDRIVALKVMSAAAIKSADAVKRFEREVRAAAKLTHPNIVHAYDAGLQDGARYLVMEYVEGSDLSQLLRQQTKFGVKQACGFIEQAARGFAAAHAKGVVHRDVKPGNLLLDKSGVVKVLDMGLARFDDEGIGGAMKEGELTQTGNVMGTVDYMAPEQALDTRHADAKSDVYGLGCTLFRVVTGEPVYQGRTLVEKILAHRDQPIPTVRKFRPEAPPALDQLLARMLAKRPADRPTMQEVADGLASIDFANSKAGSLDIPLATISTGLPTATGPAAPSGPTFPSCMAVNTPQPNIAGPGVRPRTAGAAPPRKKSILPLLAAAGAGGLLILGGVWVYIKDKDGKNVAVVEVPEGGSVQMVPGGPTPPAIAPAPIATPSATSIFATPAPTAVASTPTIPVPAATPSDTVPTVTVPSTTAPSTPAGSAAVDYALEREVVTKVLQRGGRVRIKVNGAVTGEILNLGSLPTEPFQAVDLNYYGTKGVFTDQDIAPYARLSAVERLDLSGSQITDQGIVVLKDLTTLKSLHLGSTNVEGPGLGYLVNLNLTKLDFANHSLNNKALPWLPKFTNLESISSWRTQVSDFSFLRSMPKLVSMTAPNSLLTDFTPFGGLANLTELDLRDACLINDDLKIFGQLKNLKVVRFNNTDLSDAGLVHLEGLTNLIRLELTDTYATEAGVAKLREKLPSAQIAVKTKPGVPPSQRRVPPAAAISIAAGTTAGATLPEISTDPSIVCTKLFAKASPVNLVTGGIEFTGPDGNGRRGANGIIVPAPSDWRSAGTRWTFEYRWSQTGAGVIMVHPFAAGHFRVVVRPEGADLIPGGPWGVEGPYTYGFIKKYPMDTTADTASAFPLKEGTGYVLTSRVDRAGNYQLLVNDKLVYSAQVAPTAPLAMKPPFVDPKCPDVIAAGHAALIIGPRDGGINEALQVRLMSNARTVPMRTGPPAVASVAVALTPTTATPISSSPSPATPPAVVTPEVERVAAIAVLSKQGKIKIEVNGRRSDITSAASLPAEPFHVVEISFYQIASITDQDLVPVRQMPELRDIDLLGTSVSDEGLANFAGAQNLNRIHLTGTNVRGPGIRYLINCPKLVTLRFGDKSLDDSAVPYLAQMKQVESLEAVRTDLSDLSFVRSMPNLTSLHLGGGHSRIGNISACAGSKLVTLNVEGACLVDDDLRVLQGVKTLKYLNFSGSDITDASLKYLQDHPSITSMYLIDTFVTEAGMAPLLAKFPNAIKWRTKAGSPPTPRRPIPPPKYSTGFASSNSPAATTAMAALPTFAPPPSAAPTSERKPIPAAAEQQAALKAIKEIFADDYAAAKSPDQKSALATKLLDQARQTNDDATSKFVLLNEVRTLALDAGVLGPLSDALQSQIEEFDLDPVATRLDAWNALLKRPRIDSFTIQQLTKEATTLFNQAVVDAEFDDAKRYGDFTLATTRRLANSAATIKLLTERNTALAARQKEWPTLIATAEKLKANPADPEANLVIARYLSLAAEDWPGAFPLYAKAGDPQFAELGAKSVKALDDNSVQVAAGDAWWEAAQTAKPPLKNELLGGANYWYTMAVPLMSGLQKTRIEKRIAEMAPQIPTKKIFASTLPNFSGPVKLDNSGAVPFDPRAMPNKTFGEPSSSTPSPQPSTSSSSTSTAPRGATAQPNLSNQREIIAYYQAIGGYASIRLSGAMGNTILKAGDPIPEGQFKLESIGVTNLKSVGDNELVPLQGLPDVEQLFLNGTSISAKGLANLKNLKVKGVILSGNPHLTDEVVPYLTVLPELTTLILNDVQLTDPGLALIKDCKKLKSFNLAGTKVTGTGFSQFSEDSEIESIALGNTPVNDAGLAQIRRLRKLKSLSIEKTQITDQGLSNIKDLDLSMIDLTNTNTSDASLQFFRNMQNLQVMYVSANVTDAGMQTLQAALPKCKVQRKK